MLKSLPLKNNLISTSEFSTRHFFVQLTDYVDYAQMLGDPTFWQHHSKKMAQGELIRVRAVDGTFDVQLVVDLVLHGGLKVSEWPKWPAAAAVVEDDAPAAVVVAVPKKHLGGEELPRVDFVPKAKWRVIGLDGQEHSRNHASREIAEKTMAQYMAALAPAA